MLRNLIIIAAVIIVFLLLRQRLRLAKTKQPPASEAEAMVACLSCETYVPLKEAVHSGEDHFCCQQHLRDWVDKTR